MPSRAELAKIHIAKKDAKNLSEQEARLLLEVFRKAGWQPKPPKLRSIKGKDIPRAQDPQSRKIRALWLNLHKIGEVRDPSERALAAFLKRMTGRPFLQWTTSAQKSKVIESLKLWMDRAIRQQNNGTG